VSWEVKTHWWVANESGSATNVTKDSLQKGGLENNERQGNGIMCIAYHTFQIVGRTWKKNCSMDSLGHN
jgi:hypothetical protein